MWECPRLLITTHVAGNMTLEYTVDRIVAMFIEALSDAAVAEGMPRAQATEAAARAVAGSAELAVRSGKHPGQLKDMVTSPGGTTIEGVQVLEERGMRAAVMEAVRAAVAKTKAL